MRLVQLSLLLTPVLLVDWLDGWLLASFVGTSEYGQFQRLPKAILSCLHCALRSLQAGWNVSVSEDTDE